MSVTWPAGLPAVTPAPELIVGLSGVPFAVAYTPSDPVDMSAYGEITAYISVSAVGAATQFDVKAQVSPDGALWGDVVSDDSIVNGLFNGDTYRCRFAAAAGFFAVSFPRKGRFMRVAILADGAGGNFDLFISRLP